MKTLQEKIDLLVEAALAVPGHKIFVVGGSAQMWTTNLVFDAYASYTRHYMVSCFDRAERGGKRPVALVIDGVP
eukprot:10750550-Prorocentrum_lima.AAC.1